MVSQGRYDEAATLSTAAEAYYRDTEALPDAVGDDFLGHARFHLGLIVWAQGDDVRVRSLLREAVARHDRVGAPTEAIDPLRQLGLIACATGNLDEAAMWLTQEVLGDSAPVVAASGRALPLEEAVAEAEAVLEMQRTMAGTQPMT